MRVIDTRLQLSSRGTSRRSTAGISPAGRAIPRPHVSRAPVCLRVPGIQTYRRGYIITWAGNAEAPADRVVSTLSERISLCVSAFLLTMSAVTVVVDAVSGSAVHASDSTLTGTSTPSTVSTVSNTARTTNASNGQRTSKAQLVPRVSSQWYGRNPFVESEGSEGPSMPTSVRQDVPIERNDGKIPFAGRIKWLNEVTSRITDELDVIHPPPLKNMLAKATSSEIVRELGKVGEVFGSVANDLKEGFVGLESTIESLSRGEASGIRLPAGKTASIVSEEPSLVEDDAIDAAAMAPPDT